MKPAKRGLPAGGTSVADRRFRRAEVRPGRRRRILQRAWQVVRVAAPVVALVALGALVSARVVGAKILAVDRLTVHGHHRLSLGEVEALVGHVRGESLLLVDLDQFRSTLLESRWVADVTVRRVFPSTLDVHLTEREPVAMARLGQHLYLVDVGGVIIDEYGPLYRDLDLPIVDGLGASAPEGGTDIDPARAQLAARFLEALSGRPELLRAVSQVNVADTGNVVVLLGDDPTMLHLGDQQFAERIQTYLELTPALADREREVDYVDLRFGNRVFLKDRK